MKFLGILLFLIGAVSLGLHWSGKEPQIITTWLSTWGADKANIIRMSVTGAGALILLIGIMIGRKSRL